MINIFIVEDNELEGMMLDMRLREAVPCNISVFKNGESCLNEFSWTSPDLIVLDYSLPDISGQEMLKAISEKSPLTKVIVHSSQKDAVTAAQVIKDGAVDYIQKDKNSFGKIYKTILNIIASNDHWRNGYVNLGFCKLRFSYKY